MIFNKHILYAKDAKGQIRYWSIECDIFFVIHMKYGVVGGAEQEECEVVEFEMGSRTRKEQALSRVVSRMSKKRSAGYTDSKKDAEEHPRVNELGLNRPMLAKSFDKVKNINYNNAVWQYKLDGHRCLVKNDGGELTAYSRNGKVIDTIPEILAELNIPEGMTVDGELYVHGVTLQRISSWVKRKQPDTERVMYHIYDVISDKNYIDRHSLLSNVSKGLRSIVLFHRPVSGHEEAYRLLKRAVKLGYEGIIIRPDNQPYEDGKRSKGLLKYKSFIDDEFVVTRIVPSKHGWARLVCMTSEGNKFVVAAPGSMDDKFHIMENKEKFIDKTVNVKFQKYTEDGVPFHPIATMFRSVEDE